MPRRLGWLDSTVQTDRGPENGDFADSSLSGEAPQVPCRSMHISPIAGISIVHSLPPNSGEPDGCYSWLGTEPLRPPIRVRHVLGDVEPPGLEPVLDVPPRFRYYRDERGNLAVRMAGLGEPNVLLVTKTPGYEYELRYPRDPITARWSPGRDMIAFMVALAERKLGLVAHACAFVLGASEHGVLCLGVSGAGKSTLTRLLQGADLPIEMLTDDRAVVTFGDEGMRLWGTPWPGEVGVAGAGSAPLRAVVRLRHGRRPIARPLAAGEGFRHMLATMAIPVWDPGLLEAAMGWLDELSGGASLIEYEYPASVDAARHLVHDVLPTFIAT